MPAEYPAWMIVKAPSKSVMDEMNALIKWLSLHTVCQSAICPNLGDCFSHQIAAFLIMGNVCTRNCSFCAITKGVGVPLDPKEPWNIALAVNKLELNHVVITSVTRDDLPNGGAAHFAETIRAIRANES